MPSWKRRVVKKILDDKNDELKGKLEEFVNELDEYCLGNSDTSLEEELEHLIRQYKKYNHRRKVASEL